MDWDHIFAQLFTACLNLGSFIKGFPGGSDGKESTCNEGDQGSMPGLGRSPGEGNGYPLQYSCLKNSMDRGRLESVGSPQSVRYD